MTIKSFILSRIAAFGHAFRGWWYVLNTQHNAWIHTAVAMIVLVLGLWLKLTARDWAVLVLTIAIVFMAEFLNTAIEAVVDLASPVHHPLAKVGKDVGAGAVLVAALAAVLMGLLILGPPLWQKISGWFGETSPVSRAEQTAFKGLELYSWQDENDGWQYSILEGTNRNKTLEEVQAISSDLQGVKNVIAKMAMGESLFWTNRVQDTVSGQILQLSFPPDEVVDELTEFAREKQVELYIP
jgi:diacylglycerol kinase (ATP)